MSLETKDLDFLNSALGSYSPEDAAKYRRLPGVREAFYLEGVETERGDDLVDDLPETCDPFEAPTKPPSDKPAGDTKQQLRAITARALRAGGADDEASLIEACSRRSNVFSCNRGHTKGIRLAPRRCDRRLCPHCAPRLAGRRRKNLMAFVRKAQVAKMPLVHLVLTVPSTDELEPGDLRKMQARFREWWRNGSALECIGGEGCPDTWRKTRRRHRHPVAQLAFSGAYGTIEVTKTEAGWHPHYHVIAALRPPKTREAWGLRDYGDLWRTLAKAWHGQTGCEDACQQKAESMGRREHIRIGDGENDSPAEGCNKGGSAWMGAVAYPNDQAALSDIAAEAAKYITKGAVKWQDGELSSGIADISRAIAGLRLGYGYGSLFSAVAFKDTEVSAPCPTCLEHNAKLAPDDPGRVDGTIRYLGPPQAVHRWASQGDELCATVTAGLSQLHPELWGGDR